MLQEYPWFLVPSPVPAFQASSLLVVAFSLGGDGDISELLDAELLEVSHWHLPTGADGRRVGHAPSRAQVPRSLIRNSNRRSNPSRTQRTDPETAGASEWLVGSCAWCRASPAVMALSAGGDGGRRSPELLTRSSHVSQQLPNNRDLSVHALRDRL